jgi:hypothetical protein
LIGTSTGTVRKKIKSVTFQEDWRFFGKISTILAPAKPPFNIGWELAPASLRSTPEKIAYGKPSAIFLKFSK